MADDTMTNSTNDNATTTTATKWTNEVAWHLNLFRSNDHLDPIGTLSTEAGFAADEED